MFPKAEDMVCDKINMYFSCINEMRKRGILETDPLIVGWKDKIYKLNRLSKLLVNYSGEEYYDEPYDPAEDNCKAFLN